VIKWPLVAAIVLGVVHAATIAAIAVGLPGDIRVASTREAGSCSRIADPERRARCEASLLPAAHSPMDMGTPEYGRPARSAGHAHGRSTPIDRLTGPAGTPDRSITLTAATGRQAIGGVDQAVLTFNGTTPGPTLVLTQGELVEVRLRNENVAQGVTIHWHGVDVPGREDGVAGVTQDAVLPGREYVYRFVVPDAGTYWYHTHQDSVRSVARGLLGALVVLPAAAPPATGEVPGDVTALVHTYGSATTINGAVGATAVAMPDGAAARVRVINADNGPRLVSASVPYRVVAIDGTDVDGGGELADTFVEVPAGGRADLLVPVAAGGSRVGLLGGPSLVLGPDGSDPPPVTARVRFDALGYGTAGGAQRARDALGPVTVRFDYRVGRRPGFLDGRFGDWYTINGRAIPDVPMFMVRRGDVVLMRVANRTPLVHPMHLHGHHALVAARNGVPATGAPWWVDSLEVDPGESYDLVFVADNPGVWMDHCHNLPHARAGLMTHLMYEGVSTPYRIGRVSPQLTNRPE
jgi:FtsP/CotA-like multicopper oxidase with cupredoxin domain